MLLLITSMAHRPAITNRIRGASGTFVESLCLRTIFAGIIFGGNIFADDEKKLKNHENFSDLTKISASFRSQLKQLYMVIKGVKVEAEDSS